jgi:hypothetical protein
MKHLIGKKDLYQTALFEAVPEEAINKEAEPEPESAPDSTGEPATVAASASTAATLVDKHKTRDKKLRRQPERKEKEAASKLEYREMKHRKLVELSPEAIEVADSLLKIITSRFVGLFEIGLPILTEEGARRVADLLRVHIVKRNNKFVCVGGYFALRAIRSIDRPPKTIVAELHDGATDDDIHKWAIVEFQCIPLLFWLERQEEAVSDGHRDCPDLFQERRPRRRRTAQDDEFFRQFLETCLSDTGKQLINEPANDDELAKILRVSKRTITNRKRNTR